MAAPAVLTATKDLSRFDWLKMRRQGIGGSDAAAIAGVHPYRTPLEVWSEKTGEMDILDGNDVGGPALWGTLLETPVADYFADMHPECAIRRRHAILQHSVYPFMIANIDRFVLDPARGRGVLEVKTGSAWRVHEWDDNAVPDEYMIQVQHYLAVTGADFGWIAVLLGGQTYFERAVERDDAMIQDLVLIEAEFWQLVLQKTPPPLDGSRAATEFLKKRYAKASAGTAIDLPDTAAPLIDEYLQAKADEKAAKTRKDGAQNQLCALLGDAERGVCGDRAVIWKNQHRDGYTVQPADFRKFDVR